MRYLVMSGLVIGGFVGLSRWLRIAQREHYLSGSVTRFALRWWRSSGWNRLILVVGISLVVGSWWDALTGLGVAVILVGAPVGLGLRGRTSSLALTRRLRSLAALTGALLLLGVVIPVLFLPHAGALPFAGAVALASPLLVDLALWIMAPLERRLGARYVHQATQRLARVQPVIVAITGSYGKTSTKGYLAHLLEGRRVVLASPRSYNNQAGLARTVNEHLVSGTELLIAEMGTYGPGEIRAMCAWMTPSVAVITAIGPVHLERFRRLDVTLAAKAEIAERASSVVLNGEDPLLLTLVTPLRSVGKRVIVCSLTDQNADLAIIASETQLDLYVAGVPAGSVDIPSESAAIALSNVACALGAALAIGEDPAELLPLFTTLPQPPNRLVATVGERGMVILDDTFNSNPVGARHAISLLAQTGGEGHRRVLVTPGMVELGPLQFAENRQFAAEAAEICDIIAVVGRTNRRALLAGAYGYAEVRTFPNRETAVAWIRTTLSEGDAVLYENDLPDHYA